MIKDAVVAGKLSSSFARNIQFYITPDLLIKYLVRVVRVIPTDIALNRPVSNSCAHVFLKIIVCCNSSCKLYPNDPKRENESRLRNEQ